MKPRKPTICLIAVTAIVALTLPVTPANAESETVRDTGWMMLRPFALEETYAVEGKYDMHFGHRSGASFSENRDSPFHVATVLCQETLFHNPEGAEIGEVGMCELTGAEGDTAFLRFLYWFEDGMPVDLEFIGGTGKWRYIKGSCKVLEELDHRTDHHPIVSFEAEWTADRESYEDHDVDAIAKARGYDRADTSQTLHGPHVTENISEPGNGLLLVRNNQRGIMVTEDPESPLSSRSVWIIHGTTIRHDDDVLADFLVGHHVIDAAGDLVFFSQAVWYEVGNAQTKVFDGTGKLAGIEGEVKVPGSGPRKDDHNNLYLEILYKLGSD